MSPYPTYPVGERAVLSPSDAVSRRAAIRAIMEGATPFGQLGSVNATPLGNTSQGDPLAYFGSMPDLTRWYCYYWPSRPSGQVVARIHANQWTGKSNLLVYQTGHFQRYFLAPQIAQRTFVRRMLNEVDCDVLLISMPLMGENQDFMPLIGKLASDTSGHVYLWGDAGLAPTTGTPMRYYLDSTIGAINWMIDQHGCPYEKIIAAGLSGGGEMTTLLAAIDHRVTHSYAVSGSVPFGSRSPGHDGEQMQGIDMLGVDFPDLYLMGTVDAEAAVNRKSRLLFTSEDVIFNRNEHGHVWATKDFARANGFGTEMFKVRIDYGYTHDISEAMGDWILQDVLAP